VEGPPRCPHQIPADRNLLSSLRRLYLFTNFGQPYELALVNSNFGNKTLLAIPSPTATYVLGNPARSICAKRWVRTSSGPVAEMLLERKFEHSDLPRSVDLAFPHS
jgi:hypothetical protein